MLKQTLSRWFPRPFNPKKTQSAKTGRGDEANNDSNYVLVEDKGADTTIFCFSGVAGLSGLTWRLGGVPTFEFRGFFARHGGVCNLVFFRDIHAMLYQVTPGGKPGGAEFHEETITRLKEELGATYNVTLGASGGGAAAFYYGVKCSMDRIIAFAPVLDADAWTALGSRWGNYLDVRKAFTHPVEYGEVVAVTLVANTLRRRMERRLTEAPIVDAAPMYREASPRPPATIIYGEGCQPDVRQAEMLGDLPEVTLRPVPTGRHGCPMYLKKQGLLASAVLEELGKGSAPYNGSEKQFGEPQAISATQGA